MPPPLQRELPAVPSHAGVHMPHAAQIDAARPTDEDRSRDRAVRERSRGAKKREEGVGYVLDPRRNTGRADRDSD